MPSNLPTDLPEWNEENLDQVISDLYREIETDQTLHQRLMNTPFEVLSERIKIPEGFRGGVFAREKGLETLTLYVPAFGGQARALPEGTTEEDSQPDYDVLCSSKPPW